MCIVECLSKKPNRNFSRQKFIDAMIKKGLTEVKAKSILLDYKIIGPFPFSEAKSGYKSILSKGKKYGLYIFYDSKVFYDLQEVLYIGAAKNQILLKRLNQHFCKSSGGLQQKLNRNQLNKLEKSDLLVLYTNRVAKCINFDEDLLIGLFRPKFNRR